MYGNDPKFTDRPALANSADPDLIRVGTVCHFISTFWTNYSIKDLHLILRVITTYILGVRKFRNFTISLLMRRPVFGFWPSQRQTGLVSHRIQKIRILDLETSHFTRHVANNKDFYQTMGIN